MFSDFGEPFFSARITTANASGSRSKQLGWDVLLVRGHRTASRHSCFARTALVTFPQAMENQLMDEERPEGPRSNFMVGQEPKVQVAKPILPMPTGVPTLPGGKAPSTLSAPVGVSPQQAEILSEELKKEGNQLYNDGQLEAAEMVYSEAIKARGARCHHCAYAQPLVRRGSYFGSL